MSWVSKILGRRLVQISTAEYSDGWSITPISFLLFEDRWGRRSYRVGATLGGMGPKQYGLFDGPILEWLHGGERPPIRLAGGRDTGRRKPRSACPNATAECPLQAMSPPERERLSKVLEMLNSEHDGEILNAAKAATAFLQSRSLTWAEALGVGSN